MVNNCYIFFSGVESNCGKKNNQNSKILAFVLDFYCLKTQKKKKYYFFGHYFFLFSKSFLSTLL